MVVVVGLTALVVVAGAVWWNRSTDVLIRRQTRAQVVVELTSGETFKALLDAVDRHSVTLRNVEWVTDTAKAPVDGVLLLPRKDIKWLQRT